MSRRLIALGACALMSSLVLVGPAGASSSTHSKSKTHHKAPKVRRTSPNLKLSTKTTMTQSADGVQHYHFVYGPIHINPGQNNIALEPNGLDKNARPPVDGYILNFAPNLVEEDGRIPGVDVIHLHHAVWLSNSYPAWASGEEKTTAKLPPGYGWRYKTTDSWIMNHMIHNLTPTPDVVYVTYDMDFVPDSSPQAASIIPVHTQWMDVEGIKAWPVFDALRGTGKKTKAGRRFTFPDDDPNAYSAPGEFPRNLWTVTKEQTLVSTFSHLHPGGLYGDLKITRDGVTKTLFRSEAHYWEPAGAVSWDVAMSITPPDWKINVKPGDVISVSGTYDTTKASWYESMAIDPVAVADGWHGVDPFVAKFPSTSKILTHGPLAENRNHGGELSGLPNPVKLLDGPVMTGGKQVLVNGFVYSQGNLSATGFPGRPAVVRQGQPLSFLNQDSTDSAWNVNTNIFHTITACRAPCNRTTGIAYPLADGNVNFDSGELGYGPAGLSPAANRNEWSTPVNLPTGTYTYFCRIHPFMRGSFRVLPALAAKKRS